ncbi:MAG: Uma2 family endonuclease [Stellaceae bacterium]
MSEAAVKGMTLEDFLRWEDGSDTRYELIGGFPVAMAPPAEAHRILAARLIARIDAALASRRPCNVQPEAGVLRADRNDSYFIADLAVTCQPNQRGRQMIEQPILIVEILSPGTERHDRLVKVPAYRQIASVAEILLIDSESLYAEILRRDGARWIADLVRGAEGELFLAAIGLRLGLGDLYEGIDLAPG